jgi:rhodanese-related sulfurtransferase
MPTPLSRRLAEWLWWLPVGHVPELSPQALQEALEGTTPPQLVDVRTHAEWHRSRIPGARHLPVSTLRRRLPELGLDPHRPVVAICLSAHRSIPAVRLLRRRGYPNATQLAGGMLAWWHAHLPTERST